MNERSEWRIQNADLKSLKVIRRKGVRVFELALEFRPLENEGWIDLVNRGFAGPVWVTIEPAQRPSIEIKEEIYDTAESIANLDSTGGAAGGAPDGHVPSKRGRRRPKAGIEGGSPGPDHVEP